VLRGEARRRARPSTFEADLSVWYFENVLKALEGKVPGRLSREVGELVDAFRELAGG